METKDDVEQFSAFPADEGQAGEELETLLISRHVRINPGRRLRNRVHLAVLYISNLVFMLASGLFWQWGYRRCQDPSLGVYSPASKAVKYIEALHFRAALFNNTDYMGFPTEDGQTDRLWSDLYNFGISKITKDEAAKLHTPTLAIPGTQDYLIELDVWHELHCLNDIRKVFYPEVYGGLANVTFPNGTINRDTNAFRHWDHCIDSLRQTLMCHADISPVPFHVNVPVNKGIFPRLATTHTCRDFGQIQQWARDNWAGEWDFNLNPQKAEEIIASSGFDNSPEEDIEFLWPQFPGFTWFKHWREHPLE